VDYSRLAWFTWERTGRGFNRLPKRWFVDRKSYTDQELKARKKAEREATSATLKAIMESRDEKRYIEFLKELFPAMTKEELHERVSLFRERPKS
jgi:hypothetical protein